MKTIQERIDENREWTLKRRRERYQYARANGLSSAEAQIVSSWSEQRIDSYIKERGSSCGAVQEG